MLMMRYRQDWRWLCREACWVVLLGFGEALCIGVALSTLVVVCMPQQVVAALIPPKIPHHFGLQHQPKRSILHSWEHPPRFLADAFVFSVNGSTDGVIENDDDDHNNIAVCTIVSSSGKGSTDQDVMIPSSKKESNKSPRRRNALASNKGVVLHWQSPTDLVEVQFHPPTIHPCLATTTTTTTTATTIAVCPHRVHFTVRGDPLPLRRHRTSRGFVYNPSAASQASFRQTVHDMLLDPVLDSSSSISMSSALSSLSSSSLIPTTEGGLLALEPQHQQQQQQQHRYPLFAADCALQMEIQFRLKRPKRHFMSNKPGPGRLKMDAPSCTQVALMRKDVDNLAKFVLDSMNGLLYQDDRQIVSLHVVKLLDNDGDCLGSTQVTVSLYDDNSPHTDTI